MITTFTGPMHSGKTAAMMNAYNKIWNKKHILCFKPNKDTRDVGEIRSKDYNEGIKSIGIDRFEEILDYVGVNNENDVRTIFIDEVQLMEGNVGVLSYLSVAMDMNIFTAGLNQTSEQEPFLVMPFVLAISDEVVNIKASCYDCGKDASHTYFEGEKSEAIRVGDEGYIPLCDRCLAKRLGKDNIKRLLKTKKED
jgi:thymidine kinase